jgi:hypothetical protein
MLTTLLLSLVTLSACPWRTPPAPPAAVLQTVRAQQNYEAVLSATSWYDPRFATCALAGAGEHKVEYVVDGRVLISKPLELRPSLSPGWEAIRTTVSATDLCQAAESKDKKVPRPEKLTVKLHMVADGDFAPLAFQSAPMTIPCPPRWCGAHEMGVWADANKKQVHLTWSVSRETLACAGASTLDAQFFVGHDERDLKGRLSPDFTSAGLEKRLRPDPKDPTQLLLDEVIPLSKLCTPGQTMVMVDMVGRGTLFKVAQLLLRRVVRASEGENKYSHRDEICRP